MLEWLAIKLAGNVEANSWFPSFADDAWLERAIRQPWPPNCELMSCGLSSTH